MQLRVQSYVPAPRDFQSHPDVVITTHRYPGRQPGSRTIFCSDRALQKTSSVIMPAGFVRRGFEPASLLPSRAGQSGCVQEADHPWYRRARPGPAYQVHGGGQDAELRAVGRAGIIPAFDDQHSAAEPGGVVEPDYGHECRWAWNFRFHPPRSENLSALFFHVASRRPEA